MSYVDLFVYGTLKRGHGNHRAFCSQALEITPASVPGRLYDLPRGYPGAVIPTSAILARASGDPEVDAALQRACLPPAPGGPELARERVHGEIIRLPEPRRSLPPVDALEDFRPDGRGMYRRALVAAATDHGPRIVWMYWMPEVFLGHYLPTGVWPPDEEGSPAPGAG